MGLIKSFKFNKADFEKIKNYNYGSNWPVVYLIEDGKELYVGETANIYIRSNQHYEKPERKKLKNIHIITDEEYNKSATLDIESSLIQYMAADGRFVLQNGNHGLRNHNYFDRDKYRAKFEIIWKELIYSSLAERELIHIKNSDIFKYSPYKSLTNDQVVIVNSILREVEINLNKTFIVRGGAGTGKTVLATYLVKRLMESDKTKNLKIGLVVPMTSLRKTLQKVFKNIKGLNTKMVIGPSEVYDNYDILLVDEAHRLRRRRNITNYWSFDDMNRKLGLGVAATELDWIIKCSKIQVLFYDENQSVRPSDISPIKFSNLNVKEYKLNSQIRIGVGDDGERYVNLIQKIFDQENIKKISFQEYDFKLYDDIRKMVSDIKKLNSEIDLCRIVSGYAWPWISRHNPNTYDIDIDGLKLKWNSVNHNWVYSSNSINEVGCIHTVQGYDLNYVGVIIGPELSYDNEKKEFIVYPEKYMDANGRRGVDDVNELRRYIINIYKTLLMRGIRGCYVYIVDKNLRDYFYRYINNFLSN